MFKHECDIDDMEILGDRINPICNAWLPWCIAACKKCKRIQEWQIHSAEFMHGGALDCTAYPTGSYIKAKYALTEHEIELILKGEKAPVRLTLKNGVYSNA